MDLALVKGALEVRGVLNEVEDGHNALDLVVVGVTMARGDARRAELDKIELFQKEIKKFT